MSTLRDRARALFAATVASLAGAPALREGANGVTWSPFNARIARYQRSKHRVAMDKRAATKARNVKRNKA